MKSCWVERVLGLRVIESGDQTLLGQRNLVCMMVAWVWVGCIQGVVRVLMYLLAVHEYLKPRFFHEV